MREEIKAKADELGQIYFPDEFNVWARANIEAKFVSSACIEMAEWMQRKMIEKAKAWVKNSFIGPFGEGLADNIANEFAKYLEG